MTRIGMVVTAVLVTCACLSAQTQVFFDNFDDGSPGGVVSGTLWTVVPGQVNGYSLQQLIGSPEGHQKNHTPSTDGQMGDPGIGGAAFEVDNNPYPYASYHDFAAQSGDLRVEAWVWDDVESRKTQNWPNPAQINGGLTVAALPGENPVTYPDGPSGPNAIYEYGDFAFLGIQALVPLSKPDPNAPGFDPFDPAHAEQYCYQWRTKLDGWNLTLDPNTGNPVPRRLDFSNPSQIPQTWRHLEIVVHPYTGQAGDIQFFIDGVLVGEGRREQGIACEGVPFQRVQIGSRFPEESDVTAVRPPYSYEHLWLDDVEVTEEPASLACPNPELRFDTDNDGDVDQDDLSVFQLCFGLPEVACSPPCRCLDADGDLDVDGDDYPFFEACASGPSILADDTCDDALP